MSAPRFGSVNFVLPDVTAAADFLRALGVEMGPSFGEWDAHHQTVGRDVAGADADLDSAAFGAYWGGVPAEAVPGAVLNLTVDGRDDVDRLHAQALELGASELKAPWDAFWGARYSVVLAPGPLCVGLMSIPDKEREGAPIEVSDFAE